MHPFDIAVLIADDLPPMQAFDFMLWYSYPVHERNHSTAFINSDQFRWWAKRRASAIWELMERKR